LKQGDKIKLLDDTWRLLFPQYRRLDGPAVTTLFIEDTFPDQRFVVGILDIVSTNHRTITPVGVRGSFTEEQLNQAIAASNMLRNDKPDPESRGWSSTGLDYDSIVEELERNGQVVIPIPKGKDPYSFRTSIHTSLSRRGMKTSTKHGENEITVIMAK
jgi:hypothetical protein